MTKRLEPPYYELRTKTGNLVLRFKRPEELRQFLNLPKITILNDNGRKTHADGVVETGRRQITSAEGLQLSRITRACNNTAQKNKF